MARVHIEFDPANATEVAAVVDLLAPKHSNDAEIFEMVQQILANQNIMQGILKTEGDAITVITDQIHQLEDLETQEQQAITDAAARVQKGFDDLQTQLATALADNPDAATLITKMQTDVANLANIAAASGTGAAVPTLPPTSGTPVDNPTAAPVGGTPTAPTGGDINSVTV